MGQMLDGEWHTEAEMLDHDDSGEFERAETSFRDRVRDDPDADFRPEAGRYHLYVSYACPWAHRTLITRALLGLEDAITVDVVDPYRAEDGWQFTPDREGCTADSIHDADYLREVYAAADPEYTGRVTVPVLWDRETDTIVNNESEEIIKMLADAFGGLADRDVDLYPERRRDDIDAIIDDIYPRINNGVYRAGFADTQTAYDRAVEELFAALEKYDDLLADRRYLAGDELTLADICLFTTLYRFDEVYHTHFRCNRRRVTDHPNIWGYVRELYQLPGVAATCNMEHIKRHYYRTHLDLNPKQIVPTGPDPEFEAPHDREALGGGPPAALGVASADD